MQYLVDITYLVAAACFIYGLKMLIHPKTARRGNMVSSVGMLLAVVATIYLGTDLSLVTHEVKDHIEAEGNYETRDDAGENSPLQ